MGLAKSKQYDYVIYYQILTVFTTYNQSKALFPSTVADIENIILFSASRKGFLLLLFIC